MGCHSRELAAMSNDVNTIKTGSSPVVGTTARFSISLLKSHAHHFTGTVSFFPKRLL